MTTWLDGPDCLRCCPGGVVTLPGGTQCTYPCSYVASESIYVTVPGYGPTTFHPFQNRLDWVPSRGEWVGYSMTYGTSFVAAAFLRQRLTCLGNHFYYLSEPIYGLVVPGDEQQYAVTVQTCNPFAATSSSGFGFTSTPYTLTPFACPDYGNTCTMTVNLINTVFPFGFPSLPMNGTFTLNRVSPLLWKHEEIINFPPFNGRAVTYLFSLPNAVFGGSFAGFWPDMCAAVGISTNLSNLEYPSNSPAYLVYDILECSKLTDCNAIQFRWLNSHWSNSNQQGPPLQFGSITVSP